MIKIKFALFIISFVLLYSCSNEPQPIHFNEDECDYCRMIISDQRYGAELMTKKGKAYKFDSVECLSAYLQEEKQGSKDIHSLLTIDFNNPEIFIEATQAWYLHSDLLKSPMGLNFSSFKDKDLAQTVKNVYPGELVHWQKVNEIVSDKWLNQ
jgi:copper chaperone NosL